jgi:Flp pilus assembly protein TadB
MRIDDKGMKFFEQFARNPAQPPSLVQKIVAALATVAVFAVALTFSVVLFAVVVTVGALAWGYLWWKTRALRRQMRAQPPGGSRGGLVIEGEVIREVDEREPERR